MPEWLRRLLRREPEATGLLAVGRAVLLGDEAEVQSVATAWAARQRELAEQQEARERNEAAVAWLRERVMNSPASCWLPSDER